MKLCHADVVRDFEGQALKEAVPGPNEGDPPVVREITFRTLAATALQYEDAEHRLGAERKGLCYALLTKFYRGKFVTMTPKEGALLQERAALALSPLAYGRLYDWVEGKPQALMTDVDEDDDGGGDEPSG